MPNWVKTIVKTKPDVLKDIKKKYSNEDGFSFEKVIPMPKELDVERGSRGQDGLMYLFLENDNGISKEKINQVFRSLNPFFSNIYKEKRFKIVEEKYNENKNEKAPTNRPLYCGFVSSSIGTGLSTMHSRRRLCRPKHHARRQRLLHDTFYVQLQSGISYLAFTGPRQLGTCMPCSDQTTEQCLGT